MFEDQVVDILNQAIKITLMLSAPMLGGAVLVGIMVSIFQAVTQINEQTLSFIPKILIIVGALVLFSPWMIHRNNRKHFIFKQLIIIQRRVVR